MKLVPVFVGQSVIRMVPVFVGQREYEVKKISLDH